MLPLMVWPLVALGMALPSPAQPPARPVAPEALLVPRSEIAVEEGARIKPLAERFCRLRGDPAFQLSPTGELTLTSGSAGARAELALGDCAAPRIVNLIGIGAFPKHTPTAEVSLDRGLVALHGGQLLGHPIWWRTDDAAAFSAVTCSMVSAQNGTEDCSLPIPVSALHAALPRGLSGLTLLRLPVGMPEPGTAIVIWDKHGVQTPLDTFRVPITRFILDDPPVPSTPVQAWADQTAVRITWPGAVDTASCSDGGCRVSEDGTELIVTPPAEGDSLEVELQLRDGVFLRKDKTLSTTVDVSLPLVRCRLRALAPALLAGIDDHRLPLELGDSCPRNLRNLVIQTSPASESAILTQSPDGRRLLISIGHVPRGLPSMEIRLLAGETGVTVGNVSVPITEGYVGTQARIIDPELGDLNTIPLNRVVRVELHVPDPSLASALVPVSHPGYYTVLATHPAAEIQGQAVSGGTVSILVGYRPPEANLPADAPPLAVFPADPGYQVREMSVPVSLAPEDPRANRLLSVLCRGADGTEKRVVPGQTVSLPYESRHSCRLLIDQSALATSEGPQRLRLTIAVTHPDGTSAPGGFSKVLTIYPRPGKQSIWIEPTAPIHPFDHVHVALAHDLGQMGDIYTVAETAGGLTGQEETLIFGNTRLRLYGSATIPTGLYRLTSGPDGGVVSFSAGALMRLAALDREGREFPIDLEFGLFGTGLAQVDANISMVLGFGLTVPIVNANQPTQASVGIHAWLEYAPTQKGSFKQQLGFIFGPSVSIGDFGTNF